MNAWRPFFRIMAFIGVAYFPWVLITEQDWWVGAIFGVALGAGAVAGWWPDE